ncbi:hypothetical protein ACH5RR_041723 [Cinchona calisaya]|uniref:Uncharacterized protein n=1 Tax=Cinchona calisaya TaxID=153742 RepID=A0ABD2XW48_9GENT
MYSVSVNPRSLLDPLPAISKLVVGLPCKCGKQGSSSQTQKTSASEGAPRTFFSMLPNLTPGGKAADQPKRTPVSQEEIEAILDVASLLFLSYMIWLILNS